MKWRIFSFYVLFGMVPFMALTWHSLSEYADTVAASTERQVRTLLVDSAESTETAVRAMAEEVEQAAAAPEFQLAFIQFMNTPRRRLVTDQLAAVVQRSPRIRAIALVSRSGDIVAGAPDAASIPAVTSPEPGTRTVSGSLVVTRPVTDFQNPGRVVGHMVAAAPLSRFIETFAGLDIGIDAALTVTDKGGDVIFQRPFTRNYMGDVRTYTVHADLPDLTFTVTVAEMRLFAEVTAMWHRNLGFAFLGLLGAALAALYVSRLMSGPIDRIIAGTRHFAAGNLEHRIDLDAKGDIGRLANAVDDMARDLQQRRDELAQANRLASLGLLSAGIAHEIKNPLAGLKTAAQAIRLRTNDDTLSGIAKGLEQEVDRLGTIVTSLLDFARPAPANPEPCRLEEIARRAVSLVQHDAMQQGATIATDITPSLTVVADRDQLLQVVINLLLNAANAVRQTNDARITVSAEEKAGAAVLSVSDNGHGIPAEDLPRIFDPFYSRSKTGTGLGLSIVYTLAARNNARIDVESEPGTGTTVTLTFATQLDSKEIT